MLPMNFSRTIANFSNKVPIELFDQERTFIDGVTEYGPLIPRVDGSGNNVIFYGVVLALSMQQLQFYSEGSVSTGGIALITSEPLYFTNIDESGADMKQTFIKYQDMLFRVVARSFMQNSTFGAGNVQTEIYHALRSID